MTVKNRWRGKNDPPRSALDSFPTPSSMDPAGLRKAEQEALYSEIRASLFERGHEEHWHVNLNYVDERHINRRRDARGLFRTFLANVESREPFKFIEAIHDVLDYYGAENIPALVNDEALEHAGNIIDATSHIARSDTLLPEETQEIIHYALTSENAALITSVVIERRPNTLERLQELVDEYRSNGTALRSGVL